MKIQNPLGSVTLMEHQTEALKNLRSGSILWGGVGSGKSITSLAYYIYNESPKPIYVITTARKRDDLDWIDEALLMGIFDEDHDAAPHGKITVDSWNNIQKYTEVEGAFFIFDEQRVVGTGAWTKSFIKIARKNNWILLSATPGDTYMDYAPIFVANGFYDNLTQFKREHVLYEPFRSFPKIKGYVDTRTLDKHRNLVLVEMPYKRHTKRHSQEVIMAYDKDRVDVAFKDRWNEFTDEPIKDAGEMFRCVRRIVNCDASRVKALKNIIERKKKVVCFYTFDYELALLREEFKDFCTVAEYNGHFHEPVPDQEPWLYLVQYTSGAEGWNCITTDTIVFWSLTYSFKQFEQAHGRIDRLDTPYTDLYYYIFRSESFIDRAIRGSLNIKENFNEAAYLVKNGVKFDEIEEKSE